MADIPAANATANRLLELSQRLHDQEGFTDAVAALSRGQDVTLDGVWGSACALAVAELVGTPQPGGVLVVVCPQPQQIDEFCDDLTLFSTATPARFPAWESEPGDRILHDEIYADRLRTLKRFTAAPGTRKTSVNAPARDADLPQGQSGLPPLVVTSIQSLLQATPDPERLKSSSRRLRRGQRVDLNDLLRWLTEHRFHATSAVELPGEFSSRGGIVDVLAPDWYQPVRIELFDDEVESIRRFDIATQRSSEPLDEVEITVVQPSAADRGHFSQYLPAGSVVVMVEPEQAEQAAQAYLQRLDRPQGFHTYAHVMQSLAGFPTATVWSLTSGQLGTVCHLQIESVERFTGEIERVRSELDEVGEGHDVYVVSQTEAEVERLAEILRTTRLAAAGRLHFPVGSLQQGFRLVRERVIVITSGELFHRGELRRLPRRRLGKAIDSFMDLRTGDLVVHLSHGIGRYRGIQLLDKDGRVEEHLQIEFDGGTKIYVPASRIGLVQKYIGGARTRPSLAKIGGKTWVRQKRAAEAAVVDLAAEMLEMQAERRARPGIAFSIDSDWQREFDASFPYRETPDQLTAMTSIRLDMEANRPMDRLLCGDVGFGKTELAMRAAFKAVDNGHQVALLAPTTVLVEQHFHTFRERMAEFPFDIARLSRFCSAREQREIIGRLKAGQIDIVIGTHRLASKDVKFYNLGLVIIDEEQRFGVEVKEGLKALRRTVDVLTLSATPIPRTLHMSLVGVRDISNLETPPEDRVATETRVTRFDRDLIHHAVMRELNRGGQIFFVHNRVGDIRVVEQQLKQIVPEARIRVGHGQMHERELEQVMVDFVEGKFDLLLATTIVESGLDIPNANTIFIDEADRYGLADLHQLRGRVGRYKHRAYCYLLIDRHKNLTPTAARRLRAIEEFSDMGAGFAIAMRDLEIRGAGNLLGTQQSGHIAAVGYELYCQLLESAVLSLKQLPPKMSIDVDIALPGEAYLPTDYVPDMRLKIDLYRKMSRITTSDELRELRDELQDRFGPPPEAAVRLLARTELRIEAAFWQISEIYREDSYLVFRYTDRGRIEQLAKRSGKKLRVVDGHSAYLPLSKEVAHPDEIQETVKSVLRH
jgi:transcription-repair coupling factor (superfamily II helicase)